LLLGWQHILIFVLEVSESSAESEIAIYSGIFYMMLGVLYTLQLVMIIRLVILTKWHSLSISG
jgi:hypothetical protein